MKDASVAVEETWIHGDDLVGRPQLVQQQVVGEREDEVPARRVAEQVHVTDLLDEGHEDREVAVYEVVDGGREAVGRRRAVLHYEDGDVRGHAEPA